jgi:hypothetical protein
VAHFKVLCQHLTGETTESNGKPEDIRLSLRESNLGSAGHISGALTNRKVPRLNRVGTLEYR